MADDLNRGDPFRSDAFLGLDARMRAGDDAAARAVFEHYAARLVTLAERQIRSRHRTKFDGEDIVQSALRSFFERQRAGQFELTSWDGLWGLLVRVTLRKCGRTAGYWDAAKRDAGREVSLESAAAASSIQAWQAYEPNAHEGVLLRELVGLVCSELTEVQRHIFLLDLEGYTAAEIAERVGRSRRTVRRTLAEIRGGLGRYAETVAEDFEGVANGSV